MIPTPRCYNPAMTTGADILKDLNPSQEQAVKTVSGPLLIIAGPGSGKTRVITRRIAYLIRIQGVDYYRIAAMTFTNKAAKEMRNRLFGASDNDPETPLLPKLRHRRNDFMVRTFHSFCVLLLRRNGSRVGLPSNYTIYDADDQLILLKQAMELAEIDPKRVPPQAVRSVISKAKSVLVDSQVLAQKAENYADDQAARVYHHYEELLSRNNAVDFDDLLMRAVQLFEEHADVLERYQDHYIHLMVDEFQDTNLAQYRLARLLAGEQQNICVVGDPDQSIYSWRGADVRNMLNFQHDYPDATVVSMEQNYRSTRNILEAAKGLIAANGQRIHKDLFTKKVEGAAVEVQEAYDETEEASNVIDEVSRLVREEKIRPGDCAVMYRVNAQSRALEEACLQQGMKYRLVGGVRFYQRREVRDLMAYLRVLHNPADDVSLARVIGVPPRGIGAKTMQDLSAWAQGEDLPLFAAMQRVAAAKLAGEPCPARLNPRAVKAITGLVGLLDGLVEQASRLKIVDLIDLVLEDSGLRRFVQEGDQDDDRADERWENVMELRQVAQEFNAEDPPDGLATLLERLSLVADVDGYEESEDSVTLITLHQSKGLEFPAVFIVGLEEGLLPHSRSMESPDQLEEERRLCYVGITRAQKRLYLFRAFRRGFMGRGGPTLASRFLRDIPQDIISSGRKPQPEAARRPRVVWTETASEQPPAKPVLHVGDLVRHSSFGEGVVTGYEPDKLDVQVTVEFSNGVGRKRLLLSFAPLEKIEG